MDFNEFMANPLAQTLLGASGGLLGASGWSHIPISNSQALGQGLLGAQVGYGNAFQNQFFPIQNQLAQIHLRENQMRLNEMQRQIENDRYVSGLLGQRPVVPGENAPLMMAPKAGTGLLGGELSPLEFFASAAAKGDRVAMAALGDITRQQIANEGRTTQPDELLQRLSMIYPPGSPEYQAALKQILLKPAAQVNVQVGNKIGEALAGKVGDIATETRNAALGAIDQLDTTKRIRSAIDTGQVIAGPGANLRFFGAQLAQATGLGGKDTIEQLTNTRNVIKGLAEYSLSARKALKGQGQISDFEGKLLQKAASGDIESLTLPEIKTITDVTERLARQSYSTHQQTLRGMSANPDYAQAVPFYQVPPLETTAPAATPSGGGWSIRRKR